MTRILRGLAWLLIILLVALAAVFFWLRMSLPKINGELTLSGLSAPVEIIRDRYGVPHIYAASAEDAYFALGFVHAQDRLWQMEFQRRVGAGRLAELVGEAALPTDKFLRTLSVYYYAEKTVANLNPQARGVLEAYSAGINSFLENRRGPLPPEFQIPPIRGYQPEPWTLADSLVWIKMMAWDLGGNWEDEILRARLSTRLSDAQLADLWPPYPGDAPVTLPDFRALYKQLPLDGLWAESYRSLPPGSGSNEWVVSGEQSITGAPLLANDPHLGLSAPSLWYFAHLNAPGLDVIGATFPGVPLVVLGRNDRIAWGFTNTGPDVQDMFIERINPENPGQYLTPTGYEDFAVRKEIIKVKGQDDVLIDVRESRHGPVISDVSQSAASVAQAQGSDYVLAFSWTTLRDDDMTLQAGLKLNRAKNWDDFVEALRDFNSPQQNMVYADVEGNIGYYAPARVPIRAAGNGYVPVPGWTGEYDWTGFIPFEQLPQSFNPASGQIVNANNKVVSDDYPYFITSEWTEPYRVERISELLAQLPKNSLESFARIQTDQYSGVAQEFLPYLLATEATNEQGRKAQALLLNWDGSMSADRAEPLIFAAWYRELTRAIYADELGPLFEDYWDFRPLALGKVLREQRAWCDDSRTSPVESCEFQSARALQQALAYLNENYGTDMSNWQWGEAHPAVFDHNIFSATPLSRFFDIRLANGGDAFSVNAARFAMDDEAQPFAQNWGPAYRALYDLSDLNRSRFIQNTGQSGNPLSPRYRDFAELWRDGAYIPMTTDRSEIEQGAMGRLFLRPPN